MPIKQVTPASEISRFINEDIQRLRKSVIYTLSYVGEKCVNIMRDDQKPRHFTQQTGNLVSSMGWVIACDGEIVDAGKFEKTKPTADDGPKEGRALAEEIARSFGEGIVLVLVAGMNYASYVASKGYDVADSGILEADRLVPLMLKKLKDNIKQ